MPVTSKTVEKKALATYVAPVANVDPAAPADTAFSMMTLVSFIALFVSMM